MRRRLRKMRAPSSSARATTASPPSYIQEMKAEGSPAPLEEFVRLRDHGVDAAYVQEMQKPGFVSAHARGLVRARDHGVNAEYVNEMKALA